MLSFCLASFNRVSTAGFARSNVKFFKNTFLEQVYVPLVFNRIYALFVAVSSKLLKKRRGHRTVFLRQENSSTFSLNMSTPPYCLLQSRTISGFLASSVDTTPSKWLELSKITGSLFFFAWYTTRHIPSWWL